MGGERELGGGVSVRELADGTLQVASRELELPLAPPRGAIPGTAVEIAGDLWEVAAGPGPGGPRHWVLRRWRNDAALRGGVRLDAESVEQWRQEADRELAHQHRRALLAPLLPLLGLAPGRIQSQWHAGWGFPASTATVSSALVELAIGALGVVALLAAAFGGGRLLPDGLGWLTAAGPLLAAEGLLRFVRWASTGEPVGGLLGLPLELVAPPGRRPAPPQPRPELMELGEGHLVLRSSVVRRDWDHGGELRYRDRRWRLAAANAAGAGWAYRFEAVPADEPPVGPRLALAPPVAPPLPPAARSGLGLGPMLVGTLMALFASPEFVGRWSPWLGLEPRAATVIGALIEIAGAFLDLTWLAPGGHLWLLLVDVAVLLDGGLRLARSLAGGGAVGSVLGFAFEPLVDRWLARTAAGAPPPPRRSC